MSRPSVNAAPLMSGVYVSDTSSIFMYSFSGSRLRFSVMKKPYTASARPQVNVAIVFFQMMKKGWCSVSIHSRRTT